MPTNKQRRDASRRHLERQLQRRQQQDTSRKKFTLIASIVGTVVLVAVIVLAVVLIGGSDDKKTPAAAGATSATPTISSADVSPSGAAPSTAAVSSSAAALPLGKCDFVAGGDAAKQVTIPPNTAPTTGAASAVINTNQGAMTFTFDRATAPCTVANFLSLAKQNYFNNTSCHRLTTGSGLYVLQCGDPTGSGSGGPGYSFNDELTGKEKYTAGTLAMANSGPNTNGSQFFIVYKDSTLGPNYTVFGKVTAGLDAVTKVAAKGANPAGDGKPVLPISITSVQVKD